MRFDFDAMSVGKRFEVMMGTVAPRPIAVVTSLDALGRLNAAPYTFTTMAVDPPLLGIGVLPHAESRIKDTGLNILATGELVVNLVSGSIADAMNLTSIDASRGTDEAILAGLATVPSERVAPPRLAESPVAFECRLHQAIEPGPAQVILLVQVLLVHVADSCMVGGAQPSIDTPALNLIGSMHGGRWYTRTSDLFSMDRPRWSGRIAESGDHL
jgi:flavin reductase (DIM6/NTAB) family NADH-FMN oxidoreductase RutF